MAAYVHFPTHVLAVNQVDSEENIALFKAAMNGSIVGVQNALENGAKPNYFYRPEENKNSLHIASEKGYTEIVETLLKHGAVIDSLCITNKSTALHYACMNGHKKVVSLLIQGGANVNAYNVFGNTPLHEAGLGGTSSIINFLVDSGANINAINKKGSTPLHIACFCEQISPRSVGVVDAMLKAGAEVNARDHDALTPYLVCCSSGRHDLMEILAKAGADVSARDKDGRGAPDILAYFQHSPITIKTTA